MNIQTQEVSDLSLGARVESVCEQAIDCSVGLFEFLRVVERLFIVQKLERCNGNQSKAAIELRMHRNTLLRKMKLHGIPSSPPGRRWAKREESAAREVSAA
jgi:DNA-binding NtrC family response regulator